MIPIRDINPTRRFPVVTVGLIVVNALVFFFELSLTPYELNRTFRTAGLVPYQVTHNLGVPVALDFITAMFLHGGWLHIVSNMLYLWIFGNNVEDVIGRVRFLVFYLLTGILASLAQVVVSPEAQVPTVGASGAIAGVLGAYLVLFPRTQVQVIVLFFYFIRLVQVPAVVVLGFWFVLQFFNGVASLGMPDMGGVAYFAHIGGFVAGLILIFIFRLGRRPPPPPQSPWRYRRRSVFRDEFPDYW